MTTTYFTHDPFQFNPYVPHRSYQSVVYDAKPGISVVYILQGHHTRTPHVHYELSLVVLSTISLYLVTIDTQGLPRGVAL